jgi:hypothetical protein
VLRSVKIPAGALKRKGSAANNGARVWCGSVGARGGMGSWGFMFVCSNFLVRGPVAVGDSGPYYIWRDEYCLMADKGLRVPSPFGDWADRLRGPAFALRFGPAGDDGDEDDCIPLGWTRMGTGMATRRHEKAQRGDDFGEFQFCCR